MKTGSPLELHAPRAGLRGGACRPQLRLRKNSVAVALSEWCPCDIDAAGSAIGADLHPPCCFAFRSKRTKQKRSTKETKLNKGVKTKVISILAFVNTKLSQNYEQWISLVVRRRSLVPVFVTLFLLFLISTSAVTPMSIIYLSDKYCVNLVIWTVDRYIQNII